MSFHVALAATGPVAREAGYAVARQGGNAVDVAAAAAVAVMACEPGIVSLLSGGYVNVWPEGGEPEVVDGNVEMPGRGLPEEAFGRGVREVRMDYGAGVVMYGGHGACATPGSVQAIATAVERHGRMPWSAIVEPAAASARTGYPIGAAAARYLGFTAEPLFGPDVEARRIVTRPDGSPLRAGDVATNVPLADVLDRLAAEGPSLFTTGDVGRAIAADMAEHAGLVTEADLAAYRPVVRTPVRRVLGDWDLAVNPPPSVGGPMLAVMLGELSAALGADWSWPAVIEAQRAVLAYRHAVHDFSVDLESDGHALLAAVERYGLAGLPTSSSTAHVSATDSEGLACAVTVSSGYLSGIATPGTGLLHNNALGEPELNRLGLHRVRPGTRLASNMAPTTGRAAGGRALAIGSPRADR
ncbi:gamma-glutamyltransferase, partial [Nostocoides japonicum]|uniref:gamma-glutamyltransferase n=1 Tax=Nostocoides japonicum TaxID=99481 RepID=UPI00065BB61E